MKILYAIQGTGNGHLSRAVDIVPILQKKAKLDILVSGIQADLALPFKVKYKMKGMSFIFGKKGGVDILNTYKKTDSKKIYQDIQSLPVKDYDLIINDFEPVSAWAAKLKNINCISLSHQSAILHKKAPKPESSSWFGEKVLKYYSPSNYQYGFHFNKYDDNIFTPIIRQKIRTQDIKNYGHYTVYLPAYSDEKIISQLSQIENIKWEVFSKHSKLTYRKKNIFIRPINDDDFVKSMATCEAVLCGAGFETPSEAMFLGKKLMVIPMKSQYEQQCNAATLKQMGVSVIKSLNQKHLNEIKEWINSNNRIIVNYLDNTEEIIDKILNSHLG
ncbi:MAG: hypothetical protein JXR51_00945 [Bacteroidales bacterium]|nr:hypothetical protein [Bacteroidales bacterium]MBN2755709.1 hypothetical protein [Bacteroidales bacterium]